MVVPMADGFGVGGSERLMEAEKESETTPWPPPQSPKAEYRTLWHQCPPAFQLPYLSHVANDDCHDDAVNGHSLTEDDAGGRGVEGREP